MNTFKALGIGGEVKMQKKGRETICSAPALPPFLPREVWSFGAVDDEQGIFRYIFRVFFSSSFARTTVKN